MGMKHYDVIVIGSGLAGLTVAYALKHAGNSVAVVEEDRYSGAVGNYGSTRKKKLAAVADYLERNRRYAEIGIVPPIKASWAATMEWVNQLDDGVSDYTESRFNKNGIATITGHAEFMTNQVIRVNGIEYSAERFIIATGSRDREIHCPGEQYLQSSSAFLTSKAVPDDITIIGAGIIAFAFMSIATFFGKRVHVLQHDADALKAFDQELVQKLINYQVSQGVDFHFNNSVSSVTPTDDGYLVTTNQGQQINTGAIYRVCGRVPNVEDLQLDRAGVKYNEHGIWTDQTLQTTQSNIFACGDCIQMRVPKLATYAVYQANYLGQRLTAPDEIADEIHYPLPSMSTFSRPRLAQAGVLINDARLHPDLYTIEAIPMEDWLDQQQNIAPIAKLKLVIRKSDNRVVGVTALGDRADMLINYITLLLHGDVTKEQIKKIIFAYPSMAADLSRFWR